MLVNTWSNYNSHMLAVGVKNYTTTLGKSLAISYKNKHIPMSVI